MRKVLVTEQEGLVLGLCDSILERESNGGGGDGDSWAITVLVRWTSCLTTDMPETSVRISGNRESCLLARQHWRPSLLPKHCSVNIVRRLVESGAAAVGMVHEGVPGQVDSQAASAL